MTTIIVEQPLATLIIYGKIKEVPENINRNLLKEENVLVAAGLKSYKEISELESILDNLGITNKDDLPDLRFLPELHFLGFARIVDGLFVDVEPMSEPVALPGYIHAWEKVVDYNLNNYQILKFLENIQYKNEEDLDKLVEEKKRLQENYQRQLCEIDQKITEKAQKISRIKEKDSDSAKTTVKSDNNIQAEEEKKKIDWGVVLILAIIAIPFIIFIDKIPAIFIFIAIIGEVFIWMIGGKGGLKL